MSKKLDKKHNIKETPKEAAKRLPEFTEIERNLLWHRGLQTQEEIDKFLNPDFGESFDPFLLPDMEIAATRVLKAIEDNEFIGVWTDYDADGVPGGAVMHSFFREIGFNNFINYIPDRHTEGYGLNSGGVDELIAKGVKLIITVDCGIRDVVEVGRIRSLGVDIIITDHHEQGEKLPEANAVVNPKRLDSKYPEQVLCGTGVVWKLIQAILIKKRDLLPEGQEKWLLDLVGIATLSDMVPLTGENRMLASFGLKVLQKTKRMGLRKLFNSLRINPYTLSEEDVTFMITPRINAASRMGKAIDAFNLLVEEREVEADIIIKHLNAINDERKVLVATIVREANHKIKERASIFENKSVIVLGNPNWRPALLGLAANSIAKDLNKPVFLWGREGGEIIKGSCRSEGGTNLVALMEKTKHAFIDFGGHKMSGGFSLTQDSIHTLEDVLSLANSESVKEREEIFADTTISIKDIKSGKVNIMKKLAPFGIGNEKPIFLIENIIPVRISRFGKGKEHLEILLEENKGEEGKQSMKAIKFFAPIDEYTGILEEGKNISVLVNLETSYFGGRVEERLRIVNIL